MQTPNQMPTPHLTDAEIDDICAGLKQNAAKIRFLQGLGLQVDRKPNGRPLVARGEWDRCFNPTPSPAAAAPVRTNGPRWKNIPT
jgi:hypothetical protein